MSALDASGVAVRDFGQAQRIGCGQVGQRVLLEVGPQGFDRIQFWGIGRQEHGVKSTSPEEEFLKRMGAVNRQAVPHQHHGVPEVPEQIAQKRPQPDGGQVGIRAEREVKCGPPPLGGERQGSDAGDFLTTAEGLDQHRGAAAGRPTATHQGGQQQAALVEENQRGPQTLGVFFTCGQLDRTQRRMARSSRSRARRSGFCGLQPSVRNRRLR